VDPLGTLFLHCPFLIVLRKHNFFVAGMVQLEDLEEFRVVIFWHDEILILESLFQGETKNGKPRTWITHERIPYTKPLLGRAPGERDLL
jgi:hypothetical protein